MKKFFAALFILILAFSLVACGGENGGPIIVSTAPVFESTGNSTEAASLSISERDARTCIMLCAESWICDIFGDSVESGAEVTAKIKADYYISEVEEAPYDVKSVSVRYVKFGENEYVPVQTRNDEQAAKMLDDLGYGASDDLIYFGLPQVVFHIDGEATGVYDEVNGIIDVPFVISCAVEFENGEEIIVDFEDPFISTGSGGFIELDEDSFDPYS